MAQNNHLYSSAFWGPTQLVSAGLIHGTTVSLSASFTCVSAGLQAVEEASYTLPG